MAEHEMLCRSTKAERTRYGEIVWHCTRPMGHEGNHVCEPRDGYAARAWEVGLGVDAQFDRPVDGKVLVYAHREARP